MKKVISILVAIAFIGIVTLVSFKGKEEFIGGSDVRSTKAETVVYTVGPSNNGTQTIVATSTSREWVRIVATSTGVYVNYGGGAYSATTREPLLPYEPLVFDSEHLYIGTITAKADATTTVSVTTFSN